MILNALFPTTVAEFNLNRSFTDTELECAKTQPMVRNHANSSSEDRNVLLQPAFADLNKFVENCLVEYMKAVYNPLYDVSLRITESWLNHTAKDENHHTHVHPNSFLSGVLYLQTVKDLDRIYFVPNTYHQIELEPAEWNLYNARAWWLGADPGKLVVFPSSLPHQVNPVTTETARVSLAFNTFPVGELGDVVKRTSLIL